MCGGLCVLVTMLKTRQCLLGIRTFLGVTSRIWGFIMYILRKHLRTVSRALKHVHQSSLVSKHLFFRSCPAVGMLSWLPETSDHLCFSPVLCFMMINYVNV